MLRLTRDRTTTIACRSRHLGPLFIVAMLVMIAYPAWLLKAQYGLDDLTNLNIPQRMILSWFLHHSTLPLWNPFSFGGQAFLAAGQAGVLYLPNLIYGIMPIGAAMKCSYLLHELLCAFGTYAVVYHFGRSRFGAVVGSLCFTTCGFLIGHQIHTQMFDAFTWLPICFWFLVCVLEDGSRFFMLALALSLAEMVFAGHPQMTFNVLFTLLLYTTCSLLQNRTKLSLLYTMKSLVSVALGLGLSAVQWISTLGYIAYSDRAVSTPAFLLSGSMPPSATAQFLTPFSAGGGYTGSHFSAARFSQLYGAPLYWELLCYVGLVGLVIAITTVLSESRRVPVLVSLCAVGLVAFGLCFGGYSDVHAILTSLPGFNLFRVPARYIGITDFIVSVIAGIGVSRLVQHQVGHRWSIVFRVVCLYFALCIVTLTIYGPLHWTFVPAVWVPFTVVVVFTLLPFVKRARRVLGWVAGTAAILDVTYSCMTLSPNVLVNASLSQGASKVVSYLQAHTRSNFPFTRVAVLTNTSLSHDQLSGYQVPTLNGYDALEPSWYSEYVNLTWTSDTLLQEPRSFLDDYGVKYLVTSPANDSALATSQSGVPKISRTIRNIAAGTYDMTLLLTETETHVTHSVRPLFRIIVDFKNGHSEQVMSNSSPGVMTFPYLIKSPGGPISITFVNESWNQTYQIQDVTLRREGSKVSSISILSHADMGPRAFRQVAKYGNLEVWENPDPLAVSWIARSAIQSSGIDSLQKSVARLVAWSTNKQIWRVNTHMGGTLVISQTFDPFWSAKVDGMPTPVVRADHSLTGVHVQAGTHTVTLQYQPRTTSLGTLISLLTGLVMVLVWVYLRYRKRPQYR